MRIVSSRSSARVVLLKLQGLIVDGAAGLLWFIKKMKGREIAEQAAAPTSGHIKLTLDDGTTIEVSAEVLELYRDIQIRTRAREVIAPLEREGIQEVRFSTPAATPGVVIDKNDLSSFELPESDTDVLVDEERQMAVEIVSLSFAEGNKWRFSLGQQKITAAIDDSAFVERVDNGTETFRKGDVLRCRMRIIQRQKPSGLQTEYPVYRSARASTTCN